MKANKTFYLMCIFALLMIASFIWAIVDYSWWSGVTFLVLFFITGWLGYEYAFKVKKDLKGAIDSFLGKTSIVILLVGLSFACNGQEFKNLYNADSLFSGNSGEHLNIVLDTNSSLQFLSLDDYKCRIDPSMQYHFCDKQPLDNIFIGDDSVLELINNNSINLLLEYKKECFNDSIPEITESYLFATNNIDEAERFFKRIGRDSIIYRFYDSFMLEEMDAPFADESVCVSDGINTYPIMRYEKYRIKTINTKYNHKTPSFPDFLNWIEKRKTK